MAAHVQYPAFLSYSHSDRQLAEWLHRVLESYRVPKKLVGDETPLGPVPARLTPIFKDREELSAAGSLGAAIETALAQSSALIVVCSPAAAKSRWVNEEVRAFKRLHGEARVFAVIAAGEPGASQLPGREAEECFPPAVRFAVAPDGSVTETPAEPIAADLRAVGDGKRLGKLKLVAGLIGVRLDDLVQREGQRRQRRLTYLAAASLAGMTVTSGLAVAAVQARNEAQLQRNEAQHQRSESDGLVEFMLTDLRKKLEPVGRLDVLDSVGQRALKYYAGQNPGNLDADALGRRARALHLVGEVRDLRGDSEGALKAFKQAAATTEELLARQPNDGQRIFDHSQSVFWVGYVAWQRGDIATGRDYFTRYLTHAQRLAKLDPANAAWNGEVGFANSSLGILELEENRAPEAFRYFNNAQAVWATQAERATEKRDPNYYLAQAIAWKADARRGMLDHRLALKDRQQEIGIYRGLLAADPKDSKAKEGLVVARLRTAQLHLEMGSVGTAAEVAGQSLEDMRRLHQQDPSNRLWQEIAVKAANVRAEALMLNGDWAAARGVNQWALDRARQLVAADRKVPEWRTDCLMPARWMEIAIGSAQREHASTRQRIADFKREFTWKDSSKSNEERFAWIMVHTLDGVNWRLAGNGPKAQQSFANAAGHLPKNSPLTDARLMAVANYLHRTGNFPGLRATAPASAGRVRYDVGALVTRAKGG